MNSIVELLENKKEEIVEVIREKYEQVFRDCGRFESQIYIWEDGEIEIEDGVGNFWLKSNSDRELYHLYTIKVDEFDPFDISGDYKWNQLRDFNENEFEDAKEKFISKIGDDFEDIYGGEESDDFLSDLVDYIMMNGDLYDRFLDSIVDDEMSELDTEAIFEQIISEFE